MKDCWFEKAIFTWGWFTGTMAMGIALLRVADPKMRSRYGLVFTGICLAAGLAVLATAYIKGWFIRKQ